MLNKLFGNADEIDINSVKQDLASLLAEEEVVEGAYSVFRDLLVVTSKRLMIIDKQGVTGSKKSIVSVPYKSIKYFSIETAGTFDMDSELKIWLSETTAPITKQFQRGDAILEVQRALVNHLG